MKRSDWRDALPAMALGWDLALPIFLGVLGGYYADQWLETKPFLTLGLLLLGAVTGIYNVLRFARRLDARERGQSDRQVRENRVWRRGR